VGRALPPDSAAPVVTEPSPAPEIFATSCAGCERVSAGCVRLLLCSAQRPIGGEGDAAVEHVLVLRLVLSAEAAPDVIRQLAVALEEPPPGRSIKRLAS
jgi:hypothetical protein